MDCAQVSVSSVHSPASTVSKKKLAANRRNARRSTGPRTDAGKRVSSCNATTHAIFCRDLLAGDDEQPAELIELRESHYDALRPRDAVEHGLVDSIVAARWQLRRLRAAGRFLHEDADARVRLWGGERLMRLDAGLEEPPAEARRRRRLYDALREMDDGSLSLSPFDEEDDEREARRARYEAALNDPLPLGLTMARDLARGGGSALDRLSRYEQRLEQNAARAMRKLRAYRKDLRESGPPEASSVEDDERDDDEPAGHEAEKAQNEPTAPEPAGSDEAAGGCNRSNRGTGAPPVQSQQDDSTGEAPVPRNADETAPTEHVSSV